jgi:hypothetical protein
LYWTNKKGNFEHENFKIEILNPRALTMIKEMQALNLIKVSNDSVSPLKSYLKKMRQNTGDTDILKEVSGIVEEVRSKRYAKN